MLIVGSDKPWYEIVLLVVTALCGFPSVDYAAHTIMHHLEDYGNIRYEIGYSSAIAVVLFVMMVGANMLVKKIIARLGT